MLYMNADSLAIFILVYLEIYPCIGIIIKAWVLTIYKEYLNSNENKFGNKFLI